MIRTENLVDIQETERFDEQTWCPECGGPPVNERAMVSYCSRHAPSNRGSEDPTGEFSSGILGNEAGGSDNILFCQFIHRKGKIV